MLVRSLLRRRPGPLARFAVVSVVPILLLGLVLGEYLRREIRSSAIDHSARAATLVAEIGGLRSRLTTWDLDKGLPQDRLSEFDAAAGRAIRAGRLSRVKLWAPDGTVVYSTDRALIGRREPLHDELRNAFAGRTSVEISNGGSDGPDSGLGEVVEVYLPLRLTADHKPIGAFEIYLPFAPIRAEIAHGTHTVYALLAGGLGLLWALLFRIFATVSRRLREEVEVNEHLALHDPLTGLPNRRLFLDRLERAIVSSRRTGTAVAVLLVDVDRFKSVNDAVGQAGGDRLLCEIATRISGALRESDAVSRLAGDEFVVLLPGVLEQADAVRAAERIQRALDASFVLDDVPLVLDASIGVALHPDHAGDAQALLQCAHAAMEQAKTSPVDAVVYRATGGHDPGRMILVGELRRALDEGEIVAYYQPQASARDGRIRGVEALVRWRHPIRGLLAPGEFIPLVEHTSLIRPLTAHMISLALGQCRRWRDEGLDVYVSVNLAMRNVVDPELPGVVAALLHRNEIEPSRLVLEVTESNAMTDPVRALDVLGRLDALGVQLSIDDYGTGYSSLAYLERLPVHELKIDRSFVGRLDADERDVSIVRSTIELARSLGLHAGAEGVESQATWARLAELGCDLVQGYCLAAPLPVDEMTSMLRDGAILPA